MTVEDIDDGHHDRLCDLLAWGGPYEPDSTAAVRVGGWKQRTSAYGPPSGNIATKRASTE